MHRKKFVEILSILPLSGSMLKLSELNIFKILSEGPARMPILFLGHGSPMNAIEENEFVKGFRTIAKILPIPKAILCISAHWETKGTFVTAMSKPKTIHDFGGFPKELYNIQYSAPGNPQLASEIKSTIKKTNVGLDNNWGLDHGAWSVIKHLYPKANIPVIQMSLDHSKDAKYHYELSKELNFLRDKGILIIGSGNMVHNLGMVAWDKLNAPEYGYDWCLEARAKMNKYILDNNHGPLINYSLQGKEFQLAIPSPEHYLPLLYVLALKDKNEKTTLFNDKVLAGSLSMTSVLIG